MKDGRPFLVASAFVLPHPLHGQDAQSAVPAKTPLSTVSFLDGKVVLRGKEIAFPCAVKDLTDILGKPSRTLDMVNRIYVWDDLGIYAYSPLSSERIISVNVGFMKGSYKFSPLTPFAGKVITETGPFSADTTGPGLEKLKFIHDGDIPIFWSKETPNNTVMIIMSDDTPPSIICCSIEIQKKKPAP